jgi:hypothetical protein
MDFSQSAPLSQEICCDPAALSKLVGERLLAHAWLLDRELLYIRSWALLTFRRQSEQGLEVDTSVMENVVDQAGESLLLEDIFARSTTASSPILAILGIPSDRHWSAQQAFNKLPLEVRQAFLHLLHGQADSLDEHKGLDAIEDSARFAEGCALALRALLSWNAMEVSDD